LTEAPAAIKISIRGFESECNTNLLPKVFLVLRIAGVTESRTTVEMPSQ
jgi:hypothetical protein